MQHTDQELFNHLTALRLRYTAENLENLTASLSGRTPREILSHITAIELAEQKNRSIARRLAAAGIGRYKRMEDFDWKHPLEINRAKIENLFLNDFTKLGKNLVIIGTQGLRPLPHPKNSKHLRLIESPKQTEDTGCLPFLPHVSRHGWRFGRVALPKGKI